MSQIEEITEKTWRDDVFPEWGEWLLEEIYETKIEKNNVGLWWMANMGLWIKSDQETNIAFDLWESVGKKTHYQSDMPMSHQFVRMAGARKIQPNLRAVPILFNPFSINSLDALFVTHYHHDHLDKYVMAALVKNVPTIEFFGPKIVAEEWLSWGVPERMIHVIKPGDEVVVKDVKIEILNSFDKSILITDPPMKLKGNEKIDEMGMDERSVNFLIKTSGGNIYDAGDSHFSPLFAQHGKNNKIDIAVLAYGENPIGIQDKMTSVDILRTAESLNSEIVIPIHWDAWTNMLGDPKEILLLWKIRKERFHYQFHPFLWLPGGKYIYPADKEKMEYFHPRGFDDRFSIDPDFPEGLF